LKHAFYFNSQKIVLFSSESSSGFSRLQEGVNENEGIVDEESTDY
jgi:hypothetical protein